jgi:hypothetical protein
MGEYGAVDVGEGKGEACAEGESVELTVWFGVDEGRARGVDTVGSGAVWVIEELTISKLTKLLS